MEGKYAGHVHPIKRREPTKKRRPLLRARTNLILTQFAARNPQEALQVAPSNQSALGMAYLQRPIRASVFNIDMVH